MNNQTHTNGSELKSAHERDVRLAASLTHAMSNDSGFKLVLKGELECFQTQKSDSLAEIKAIFGE